jgi:tRNA (cmo5U34)-methyltransferase
VSTTPSTASDYFGSIVESYDSLIRRAVPRYDEMTARLLEYIPPSPRRILELGCGTGNLTLRLAERFPRATITTVDAAPQMTEVTGGRAKASGFADRFTTVTARFEELTFSASSCDLITSCMSLHHVRDKQPLYRSFARWLAPGGALRIADQFLGATDAIQKEHWDLWLRFCREPGHCSENEVQSLLDHAEAHDHYEPLHAHFAALAGAGFAAPDCVWRYGMYAVLTAERP